MKQYSNEAELDDKPSMHKPPPFWTISGLVITLTFDLLISESNQLILVHNCTNIVNMVKFSQTVYKILHLTISMTHEQTHGCTDERTTPKQCLLNLTVPEA